MTTPPTPTRTVVHTLTSLRFFAALAVFFFHASLFFLGTSVLSTVKVLAFAGPTGVSFFFVLSGFVLTWSHRPGDRSRDFFRRRFARIYPLHLLSWLAAGILLTGLGFDLSGAGAALSAVLLQAWVPSRDVLYAMDAPSWSLSCEAFFYALFPFVLPSLTRLRPRAQALAMAALVVVVAGLAVVGPALTRAVDGPDGYVPEFLPLARLPEFLLGALLALAVRGGWWPRIPFAAAATLTLGAGLAVGFAETTRFRILVTLAPFVLLIGAAVQTELADGRRGFLRHPWAIRLGQWSYAFYLVHGLVIIGFVRLAGHHRLSTAGALFWTIASLLASTAISAAAFLLVERPLERRLRPGHAVPAPLQPVAESG